MRHVEQLIIRHFSDDDLSPDERASMREHLRSCEACRDEYDLAAELLRASAETDDEPTRGEMDAWRQGLVEAMEKAEAPSEADPDRSWLKGWLMTRLVPLVAVTALVLVALLVVRQPTEKIPEVQFRGTPDTGAGAPNTAVVPLVLVDLEIHAVNASGPAPVARRLAAGGAVALDEFIQIFRICSSERIKHLYVLGLDSRWQPLDYYPRPSAQQSISVAACSTKPRAVGRSIRLARRHVEGQLWVVALYSEKPLTREGVHGIITRARTAGMDDTTLETLDFGVGVHPVFQRFVVTGGAN